MSRRATDGGKPRDAARRQAGAQLRAARELAGWPHQRAFAEQAGISQPQLARIETGECAVTPRTRALVASVLGAGWDTPAEEERCRPDCGRPDTDGPTQYPPNHKEGPQG